MTLRIHHLACSGCDVWIGETVSADLDYCYGGTRLVHPGTSDSGCRQIIERLIREESGLKNSLINEALDGVDRFTGLESALPDGYLRSRIGGGRCIIRPRNEEVFEGLSNPKDASFVRYIRPVMEDIGKFLNANVGRIKLTPDFGRFEGVADILSEFTPHVLGIACDSGGCGGKSSYTVTGIVRVLERAGFLNRRNLPVTLIGSAGALGKQILNYLQGLECGDLAVCDLQYDFGETASPPPHTAVIPSTPNRFTDAALGRGGWIIAATYGGELERSCLEKIPEGSHVILAHNLSLPDGEPGYRLAKSLEQRGIECIPGQMLTFGGALTSRLEWFHRREKRHETFQPQKSLAHQIVREVADFVFEKVRTFSEVENVSLYEAMCRCGGIP